MGQIVRRYQEFWIIMLLFFLALIPRTLQLDLFDTVDEPIYLRDTLTFGKGILNGNLQDTLGKPDVSGIPAVTTRWSGIVGLASFRLAEKVGLPISGIFLDKVGSASPNTLAAARFPTVLLASISVIIMYLLIDSTLNKPTAILAAAFLAVDPFYVALSRVLGNDALHAIFALLCISFLVPALKFQKLRWFVLSGICGGLALLSKSPASILFPEVTLISFFAYASQLRKGEKRLWKWLIFSCVLWLLIVVVVFFILWPSMWVNPLETAGKVFDFASGRFASPNRGGNFFWGQSIPDPGPFFYPVVIVFRQSPLVLAGVFVTLIPLANGLRTILSRKPNNRELWSLSLWVMASAYLLILTFGAKKFDRYILPVLLALDVLASIGIVMILESIKSKLSPLYSKLLLSSGVGLVVFLQVVLCLSYFPYYFSYYNPVLGGGRVASKIFMMGWGEGIDQVVRHLNSKSNAQNLRVGTNYYTYLLSWSNFFKGQVERFPSDVSPSEFNHFWGNLDYVVLYNYNYSRFPPAKAFTKLLESIVPEYVVKINDIEYASVYQVSQLANPSSLTDDITEMNAMYDNAKLTGIKNYSIERDENGDLHMPIVTFWQVTGSCPNSQRFVLKLINHSQTVWGMAQVPVPCEDWESSWNTESLFPVESNLSIYQGTPPGEYFIEGIMFNTAKEAEANPVNDPNVKFGPIKINRNLDLRQSSLDLQYEVDAQFSEKIQLLGYNWEDNLVPNGIIHLTLFWKCLGPIDRAYTTFIHVLDHNGNIVAQKDNEPITGFYPTTQWQAGEIIRDQYIIELPEHDQAPVELKIGLYDKNNGERIPIQSLDGKEVLDGATSLNLSCSINSK